MSTFLEGLLQRVGDALRDEPIVRDCPPVRSTPGKSQARPSVPVVGNREVYDRRMAERLRDLGFFAPMEPGA